MQPELFYLKVSGVEGLDYVFKRSADEHFILDPDLGFAHDIAYSTNDDAQELMSRAFTLEEATAAGSLLFDAYSPYVSESEPPQVNVVRIDPRAALWTFLGERRLLRVLQCSDEGLRERLNGLLFALPSEREDGIRGDGELFYRRSETEIAQDCYTVEALRITPPARVRARFGHRFEMPTGPRARAERFGFIEWNCPADCDMLDLVTSACRVLRADEAEAIANSLAASENFREARIITGTLRQLDATEGLGVCSDQLFAQASPAQEARVGFPHFLSIFPIDDGNELRDAGISD